MLNLMVDVVSPRPSKFNERRSGIYTAVNDRRSGIYTAVNDKRYGSHKIMTKYLTLS
jgi:hypothetical protein